MKRHLLSSWLLLGAVLTSFTLTAAMAQTTYERYPFRTLAGTAPGSADGQGGSARFNRPGGTAVDGGGNIYLADTANSLIRKITPDGAVTTVAGAAGVTGNTDGNGSAARFRQPGGVAVDGAGNIYVADTGNQTIRKITKDGVVSTLAGSPGLFGSDDGTGAAARFFSPSAIAVDSAGNLFVADSANSTIRKITPAGVVSTFAGTAGISGSSDAAGAAAQFAFPDGIAVDGAGNVYVADTVNDTVRKIGPDRKVSTLAGSPGTRGNADGVGGAAKFNFPEAVAVDTAGNLYVADAGNNLVRAIAPNGNVSTLAGSAAGSGGADGAGAVARFNYPDGIAVDATGVLYLADRDNNNVRKIASSNVTTLAGAPGASNSADGTAAAARFRGPRGVAVDSSGTAFVADTANNTIRKITSDGVVSTFAGSAGIGGSADGVGGNASFKGPVGLALDGAGNLYVADSGNNTIRRITPGGVVTTLAGSPGSSGSADGSGNAARFNNPEAVAVDGSGVVYVADSFNATIRTVTPAGSVTTLAGTAGNYGSADGAGSAAQFDLPTALALDSANNLFVADTSNSTIRKIVSGGQVTTVAGRAGSAGAVDGTGTAARFNNPQGVAVDGAGNLYVGDTGNDTVRKITPSGAVTTLAGLADGIGSTDGTGSGARFSQPQGLAVNAAGLVYVADTQNNAVRVGGPNSSSQLLNIATRLRVQTGDNVLIGGFIVVGSQPKKIVLRAIGPSSGVAGALADPTLELRDGSGTLIKFNNDWKFDDEKQTSQEAAIRATGVQPSSDLESTILTTLAPNAAYTAAVRGNGGTTGVASVEAYDLNAAADCILANISTRGFVETGDNVMIGGFILGGGAGNGKVIVRAIGPSLGASGVSGALADPVLELHDSNGATLSSNDNWKESDEAGIRATGIPPSNDLESAIVASLPAGAYTAIVHGKGDATGVALVEVYSLQ